MTNPSKRPPKLLSGHDNAKSRFYLMDLRSGEVLDFIPPQSFSERPNTPSYSQENIIGRSSQPVNYLSSDNRSISTQLIFIDDYTQKSLIEVSDIISSMVVPNYTGNNIIAPNTQLRLGAKVIRGVLTSVSFDWDGQYRDGSLTRLTVSIEMKEVRSLPLGGTDIRKGGWNNG